MKKEWIKIEEDYYSFFINGENIGSLKINAINSISLAKIREKEFTIKRTGFWKNTLDVTNNNNDTIAKVYYEKWYTNSFILDFKGIRYKLSMRNNPLAEWIIFDEEKEILAYGLNTSDGKAVVKISSANDNNDLLLDYILWYLFLPIAVENCGDNFVFLMLLLG